MAKNIVLGIVHTHANRILYHATEMYCQSFRRYGYDAMTVDLADAQWVWHLGERLKNGDVAFAFGIQGVGSQLEDGAGGNLWSAARTPFLCLHHDHPCYNPANHVSASPLVANIYFFPSFLDVRQRYLPGNQIAAYAPYELLEMPAPPQIPFAERPVKILFLKGGATLDQPVQQIKSLIPRLRDGVFDQLARAESDPNLQICDLVQELFDRLQLARATHDKAFWGIAQVMDVYLRRKRAIDFVHWLKLQSGAVIIGDGWDFIDRADAKAEFRPSVTSRGTISLYEQAQFICNTNPYGCDIIHERVLYGMAMGGYVISDRNAWLDQHFGNTDAFIPFDFGRSLDAQLAAKINGSISAPQGGQDAVMATCGPRHMVETIVTSARAMIAALESPS